eukprot:1541210-Rhodomonas_salina.1
MEEQIAPLADPGKSVGYIPQVKYNEILNTICNSWKLESEYKLRTALSVADYRAPPPQLPALTEQHRNWMARFDLLESGKDMYLMLFRDLTEQSEASISDQKYQWLCPKEDMFEFLWKLHFKQPGGHHQARGMWEHAWKHYTRFPYNITRPLCTLFVDCCTDCAEREPFPVNQKRMMELKKTHKWEYVELILMAAQDHFTKYCWLWILDEHTAYAVSDQDCSIDHEHQDDSVYLEIQDWYNYLDSQAK